MLRPVIGLARSLALRAALAPVRALAYLWFRLIGALPYSVRRRYVNDERRFKARMLRRVARVHGYRHLVETGTHEGGTVADLLDDFDSIVTIEIDPSLHAAAARRFAPHKQVTCVLGDSKDELTRIGPGIEQPTLFWLDGHYSGIGTGGAGQEYPLAAELRAIGQSPAASQHLIVIDDISDFTAQLGNEPLSSVLATLEELNPAFTFYFDFDMLFAVPSEPRHRDFWRRVAMPTYVR